MPRVPESPPQVGGDLYRHFDTTTGVFDWVGVSGIGVDHALLGANLSWSTSGHVGVADRAAVFNGSGDAAYLQLGDLAIQNSINNSDWSGAVLTIANGGTGASSAPVARANLGAQAQSGHLDDLASLGVVGAADTLMVSTGAGTWAFESGATMRTSLGLGTTDDPAFNTLTLETRLILGANDEVYWSASTRIYGSIDLHIDAGGSVLVEPTNDLIVNATDDIFLDCDNLQVRTTGNSAYFHCDGGTQRVGVGITVPSYRFDAHATAALTYVANIENDSTNAASDGLRVKLDFGTANTFNYLIGFLDGGGNIGRVAGNGVGVSYVTTSDAALKKNIRDATGHLGVVRQWQVREFEWRRTDETEVGFIAQELAEHCPRAVDNPTERNAALSLVRYQITTERGAMPSRVRELEECIGADDIARLEADPLAEVLSQRPITPDDNAHWTPWGIDYGRLTSRLTGAVQELAAKVDVLEGQLAAQSATIATLTERLDRLESA